jgi:hypothetical protein
MCRIGHTTIALVRYKINISYYIFYLALTVFQISVFIYVNYHIKHIKINIY